MTIKSTRTIRPLLGAFILQASLGGARAEEPEPGATEAGAPAQVEYALIFPDEKAPETVKPEEENPFVALTDLNAKEDVGNSEENKIKDMLLAMEVVGASPRPQGYRVQLGDLILEAGMIVPAFLPDQSVQLRVNSITEEHGIEFVWLEKQRTGLPPRTLLVPIKIKPMVRFALPGQKRGGKVAGAPVMGLRSGIPAHAQQAPAPVEPKKGEVVEETPAEEETQPKSAARKKSAADSVLDMFFNQGGQLPVVK